MRAERHDFITQFRSTTEDDRIETFLATVARLLFANNIIGNAFALNNGSGIPVDGRIFINHSRVGK